MNRTLRLASVFAGFALAAVLVSCAQQSSKAAADAAAAAKAAADSAKTAAAVQRGQHLFLSYCAMCHGDGGAGDGEVAGRFARDSVIIAALNNSDRMDKLTAEELRKVIAEGGKHNSRSDLMPPWATRLTPEQIDDIVQFVLQLRYMNPSVPNSTMQAYLAAPEGVPADGRVLFVHHCVACHGSEGKGDGPFAAKLLETAKVQPRNLTDAVYFKDRKDSDLFATIALGGGHFKKAVQMPAWTQTLSPAQIKSLVAYVRSLSHTESK
ncbi:MAG: c-type cytochrome [Candidatus Eisenbacteria bacterium]